jgi:hypothetical protein
MMTFMFVIVFCAAGTCEERRAADGSVLVFESFEACKIERAFVREERKGRLSCQGRVFEFGMVVRR